VAAGSVGHAAIPAATEAGIPDADRRADFVKTVAPQVEALAEGLGNVRLDGLTLGLSGDPTADPPTAAVVLLARCTYDRPAARAWLEARRLQVREMAGGAPGVELGPELTLLLPSDRHVALLAAADPKRLPTAELARAVAAGRGPLAEARGPVADWLRKNDPKHPAWAVGYFSLADHRAGVPEGVDWVAGHGQWLADPPASAGLDVHLLLTGQQVESIHAAADAVSKAVEPFRKPPDREEDLSMTEALTARLAAKVGAAKSPTGAELTLRLTAADVLAAAERAARRAKE
ncbi:MAG TPA: hypothetical protein VF796_28310, partial [Humisphaera sp.]